MKTYGQYCPIARGAEIFAERWTPLIVRNLHMGCDTFGALLEGAPGMSRSMLSRRIEQLERIGVVETRPKSTGHGRTYHLTEAGHALWDVCDALGTWGARWLELAPEHLDPGVTLWSMCKRLDLDALPARRLLVEIDFVDVDPRRRYWLHLGQGAGEVCREHPGGEVHLWVTAEVEPFTRWHMGRLDWGTAVRDGSIQVHGPARLVRAFPTWNRGSPFGRVEPAPHHRRLSTS